MSDADSDLHDAESEFFDNQDEDDNEGDEIYYGDDDEDDDEDENDDDNEDENDDDEDDDDDEYDESEYDDTDTDSVVSKKELIKQMAEMQLRSATNTYKINDKKDTEKTSVVYIIPHEDHKTRSVLSKYEYAQLKVNRIKLLQEDPTAFVDITGITDPEEIAIKELRNGKCPLLIERRNKNIVEIINPNEMLIPDSY